MNEQTRWRPEGWAKLIQLEKLWNGGELPDMSKWFEVGADAMLEALKNKTSHPQVVYEDGKRTGILIFMPDEAL